MNTQSRIKITTELIKNLGRYRDRTGRAHYLTLKLVLNSSLDRVGGGVLCFRRAKRIFFSLRRLQRTNTKSTEGFRQREQQH